MQVGLMVIPHQTRKLVTPHAGFPIVWGALGGHAPFFSKLSPHIKTDAHPWGIPPLKNEAPQSEKRPPPPLKREAPLK